MRQRVAAGNKVLFGGRRFVVQNLDHAGLELRHVRDVVGGDPVLSRQPRQDDGVDARVLVQGPVGEAKVQVDGGRCGGSRRLGA